MMEKRAVVTINVGGVLCPNARRSFEAAAERWKADYVELNGPCTPEVPGPSFLKLELFRLCAADRAFYIDGGDALIRSDAPTPFDLCPPTHLGAVRNGPDRVPFVEDIRDQQEIEWALFNHCLGTRYACASYFNAGMLVLTRATHAGMLDRARRLVGQLSEPRRLVRWQDQTFLNYAAVDLGVPILLMDETWNYTQPEDIGHWNGMERFVYHLAGSPDRLTILPTLDWQAQRRAAWRARARRLARNVYRRIRRAGANPLPAVAPAERQPLHRLALKLAQEAICRQADQPVTRLDQLRVLPVRSGPITQAQFMTPEFLFWCNRLKEAPRWHRKVWEYVMICQALWERDMLRAGRRGCGFGAGQEYLPAVFASLGCEVLATDAPAASPEAPGAPHILPPAEFRARVGFRAVDMTKLPEDLGTFDFLWSSCALAHFGDLRQGIEFVEKACRHLRPGGVAVYTTEFNVSSNEKTVDRGPVVLFRRRDVEEIQRRVRDAGCRVAEPDFDTGSGPLDLYADRPPYGTPHLKLAFREYVTTSFLMIVEKPAAGSGRPPCAS
ncbi:MAG: methyltransferase domain-containing protein [Candidatus Brocadiia bacterium]|jgi:SAM-dependent methyltransferase